MCIRDSSSGVTDFGENSNTGNNPSFVFTEVDGNTNTQPGKPNVILIMADDLGWGDVGYNNASDSLAITPNIDAMAAAGLQMNRFYSGGPVCSPTRASFLTGRHPYRNRIYHANVGSLDQREITIPEVLKEHGYLTGHFGKWHLGTMTTTENDSNRGGPGVTDIFSPPWLHGNDVVFATEAKVPTYDPLIRPATGANTVGWDVVQDGEASKAYGTSFWSGPGQKVTDNMEGDDSNILVDRVLPFIRDAAGDDQPFLATVWMHTPHLPVVASAEDRALFPDAANNTESRLYGSIYAMDRAIGRIRTELRDLGIEDNTILWFTSDNGAALTQNGNNGSVGHLRGAKVSLFEGGIRVPGVIEWPATISAGSQTDMPAVTSDILPTLLDILNAQHPAADRPLDGISLLPAMAGQQSVRNAPIGFESRGQLAFIDDRYKLYHDVSGVGDNQTPGNNFPFSLYDIIADPSETNDLSATLPDVVSQLSGEFDEWRESVRRSIEGEDY